MTRPTFLRLKYSRVLRYNLFVNGKGSARADTAASPTVEATRKPRGAPALAHAEGEWLCGFCLNRVAHDQDRFKYEGKDQFTFYNPDGMRFEIITFTQTAGCQQTGVPTLEHTWFPGCAWSFCVCNRCGQHLGWYYSGAHDFAGLILNRIISSRTWN
ncbi:hypothetical protein SBV1_1160013 [Verrucomicrobia bacterium]|nr:hypothetical protein SBV1_1160013 [Verrucomicrobiota bacterium]